jgi:lysozyme family protein
MSTTSNKIPDFHDLWKTCKLDQSRLAEVKKACDKIRLYRADYEAVEKATGVPWKLIAALHYRESSLRFDACLHNGDPWNKVTVHVPKGLGPWKSWSEAAIDALKHEGFHHIRFTDEASQLVMGEKYNGMGYRRTGELSPYVWAGTNHHDETGKYVADGKYDPNAIERQLGLAAIMLGLS